MIPLEGLKIRDLEPTGFMSKRQMFALFNEETRLALVLECSCALIVPMILELESCNI